MVMKAEQKGDKIVYTFKQQKNNHGTNRQGGENFSSPDSDGKEVRKAMRKIKDKETVTVTIAVDSPKIYHVGQRFTHYNGEYILANTNFKTISLISLRNGNRWSNPIKVANVHAITGKEMRQLTRSGEFKPIEE